MLNSNRILCLLLTAFAVTVFNSSAKAVTLISPDVTHNSSNAFPFGPWYDNETPIRYQQIWDASNFSEPVNIEAMAFSPLYAGNYSADITIRLTQTSTAFTELSSVLDSNITGTLTTVLSDSNFSQTISDTGTESFSFIFDFKSNPFLYDPSTGDSLLMDVLITDIVYDNVNFGAFSASNYGINGYTGRIYEFPSGSVSGDLIGLRTQFTVTEAAPVPEPSTILLLGSGLFGFGALRKKFNS